MNDKIKRPVFRKSSVDLTAGLSGNDENSDRASLASVMAPELDRPHADPDSILLHINQCEPDPNQPRKTFDNDYLAALGESIKENGQAMAIVVEPLGGGRYRIVDGECRWRAIRDYAKQTQIRATVKKYDENDANRDVLQISANEQRENYTKLELARGYERLQAKYEWSDAELARRVNKPRQYISAVKSVLKAPAAIQDALQAGRVSWRDWVRNPDEVMSDFQAGVYSVASARLPHDASDKETPAGQTPAKKKSKNKKDVTELTVSIPLSAARVVMQLLLDVGEKNKLNIEPPKEPTRKQIGEFIAKNVRKIRKAL